MIQGKTFEMNVYDWDYLRILEGGNFINFVCVVYDGANEKSVITTENFRLKVRDYTWEGGFLLWQYGLGYNNKERERWSGLTRPAG